MSITAGPGPFAVLLQQYRVATGLSQDELAERAGLSRRGISDLERGQRRSPHPATARRLADGLGLDVGQWQALLASTRATSTAESTDPPGLSTLPVPPTGLIGRESELAEVRRLLSQTRLLTLTGPGGSGKTRLAMELARASVDAYADGTALVVLAPLAHPELVAPTIARVLGVRERTDMSVREALVAHLVQRQLLLMLDNFEHLLEAGPLISGLLGACPRLTVLATSREALRLRDEQEFPVPPLALPTGDPNASAAVLMQCASVKLFGQRAAQLMPDFRVTAGNARIVGDICMRLDGLPLAIELAAARVKVLSPALLLERLEHRLPLLVGGARELPARQRTLRDTIAWSHDLLGADDRRLFRRLAVFVGGSPIAAVEALGVIDTESERPVLDGLASLVDKNLLQRKGGAEAEPRFTMLETIREFALEQLELSGEVEQMRRAHAAYYLTWLATTDPRASPGPAGGWMHRVDLESDNLRAAMRWSLDHSGLALVTAAGTAVTRYGIARGHFRELRRWWEEALERSIGAEPSLWPTAGFLLAIVLFLQGDNARVVPLLDECLTRFRQLGDKRGMAHVLLQLGWAAPLHGKLRTAVPLFREAERLFRELGQHQDIVMTLLGLGNTAQLEGDLKAADAFYVEALAVVQDPHQASTIAEALGLEGNSALVSACAGSVAFLRGDLQLAEDRLRDGVLHCTRFSNAMALSTCVMLLAGVALARGRAARAARLLGAAEGLLGADASGLLPSHRALYDRICADFKPRLDEPASALLRTRGGRMISSEVVAYALGSEDDPMIDHPLRELTRREREVARLAARGLSNRDIGRALIVTEGTARVHVEHVLAKLDLHSRAQLAAWAMEHRVLISPGDGVGRDIW